LFHGSKRCADVLAHGGGIIRFGGTSETPVIKIIFPVVFIRQAGVPPALFKFAD
jgi:hypothetical protein